MGERLTELDREFCTARRALFEYKGEDIDPSMGLISILEYGEESVDYRSRLERAGIPYEEAAVPGVGTVTGGAVQEVRYAKDGRPRVAYIAQFFHTDTWAELVAVVSEPLTADRAGDLMEGIRRGQRNHRGWADEEVRKLDATRPRWWMMINNDPGLHAVAWRLVTEPDYDPRPALKLYGAYQMGEDEFVEALRAYGALVQQAYTDPGACFAQLARQYPRAEIRKVLDGLVEVTE